MNLVEWVSIAKKYTKTTTFTYRTRFFLSRCDVTIYSFFLLFSFPFSVHSKIGGKKCSYNAVLVTAHSFMNIVFAFANHRRFVVGRFFSTLPLFPLNEFYRWLCISVTMLIFSLFCNGDFFVRLSSINCNLVHALLRFLNLMQVHLDSI